MRKVLYESIISRQKITFGNLPDGNLLWGEYRLIEPGAAQGDYLVGS